MEICISMKAVAICIRRAIEKFWFVKKLSSSIIKCATFANEAFQSSGKFLEFLQCLLFDQMHLEMRNAWRMACYRLQILNFFEILLWTTIADWIFQIFTLQTDLFRKLNCFWEAVWKQALVLPRKQYWSQHVYEENFFENFSKNSEFPMPMFSRFKVLSARRVIKCFRIFLFTNRSYRRPNIESAWTTLAYQNFWEFAITFSKLIQICKIKFECSCRNNRRHQFPHSPQEIISKSFSLRSAHQSPNTSDGLRHTDPT